MRHFGHFRWTEYSCIISFGGALPSEIMLNGPLHATTRSTNVTCHFGCLETLKKENKKHFSSKQLSTLRSLCPYKSCTCTRNRLSDGFSGFLRTGIVNHESTRKSRVLVSSRIPLGIFQMPVGDRNCPMLSKQPMYCRNLLLFIPSTSKNFKRKVFLPAVFVTQWKGHPENTALQCGTHNDSVAPTD